MPQLASLPPPTLRAPGRAAHSGRGADSAASHTTGEGAERPLTLTPQARAQSDEYTTRMNTYKFDSGTFGSTVSVPEVDEGRFRYKP